MKKIIAILLLLVTVAYSSSNNLICLSLDWQLSLRYGMEHKFNDRIGGRFDIGAALFGLVVADALMVFYLLPEDNKWQVNICAGIPHTGAPFTFEAAMVSVGASVLVRRSLTERLNFEFRLGEGFPFFFEKDKDIIRDINFPLNLWPDIMIGLSWTPRKKR